MNALKKVLILMPLTIPASGKSTVLCLIKQKVKKINVQILSSDAIRRQKMQQLMAKNPQISKNQAYGLTKNQADKQYFHRLQLFLQKADEKNQYDRTVVLLDKNYSLITFQQALNEINKISNRHSHKLSIRVGAIVPKCKNQLKLNSQISLLFSSCYIASCLKRVLLRDKHQTLQGSEIKRVNTCIGWANNFRNFNIGQKLNQKKFDCVLYVQFTKQQQVSFAVEQYIKSYLIKTPVNCFSENQDQILDKLIEQLKKWSYQEINAKDSLENIEQQLENLF